MTPARLADLRARVECGGLDQYEQRELIAEIDRLGGELETMTAERNVAVRGMNAASYAARAAGHPAYRNGGGS